MTDEQCTCPIHRDRFDPYYQCAFCERRQEEAQREEDGEMIKHRIFLEALSKTPTAPAIPAGYYGPVKGVSMNEAIYCRVERDDAWTFDPHEAARRAASFKAKGYPARCEPPVTITY